MTHGQGSDGLELSSLQDLYQQVILEHYRRPRNKGPLEGATHTLTLNNPLCGDVIDLMLRVEGDRIVEVHFEGKGCSISQASASMMDGVLKGKSIPDALLVMDTFTRMLHGDADAAAEPELGDLRALAGVSKFPIRVKCALLAWNCLDELVGPEASRS
ncbi:MAG: SUF system NifU family Fe-S cluster assembly protein [marine benthic group bacterium]|jgi:nitrogen fixation NifU-like protein|nr:SUF system NifU family Fe-S cluster assembly protein [Candidatus Benthicola marisminoris]